MRSAVLSYLPMGFDWTNYEYLQSFSKLILILLCVYYCFFNVLPGPVTEELYPINEELEKIWFMWGLVMDVIKSAAPVIVTGIVAAILVLDFIL